MDSDGVDTGGGEASQDFAASVKELVGKPIGEDRRKQGVRFDPNLVSTTADGGSEYRGGTSGSDSRVARCAGGDSSTESAASRSASSVTGSGGNSGPSAGLGHERVGDIGGLVGLGHGNRL